MSRAISAAFRAAAFASATAKVPLVFLTLSHPSITTVYLVNNTEAITRGGQVYQPFAFIFDPPPEKDDQIGNAKLAMDTVDLTRILDIRTATTPLTAALVTALADTPDTTEVDYGSYTWRNVTYNESIASGDLAYDDLLDILLPGLAIRPETVPGAF